MEIILLTIAGMCEGLMDWLQFRYAFTGDSKFWNPQLSWYNKWKKGTTNVERFWQSSRALVFLTDGWHLMKFFRNLFIFLAVFFLAKNGHDINTAIIITITARLTYGIGFSITYNYIHKL